jgi:hypothetical protein
LFITQWDPVEAEDLVAILTEYNTYRVWWTGVLYSEYFATRQSKDDTQN